MVTAPLCRFPFAEITHGVQGKSPYAIAFAEMNPVHAAVGLTKNALAVLDRHLAVTDGLHILQWIVRKYRQARAFPHLDGAQLIPYAAHLGRDRHRAL